MLRCGSVTRALTPAVVLGVLGVSLLAIAAGASAFHTPEDPEEWSHHVETEGGNTVVLAVETTSSERAFDVSAAFTADYPESPLGTATLHGFDGGLDESFDYVHLASSETVGDTVHAKAGPLTVDEELDPPEVGGPENGSGEEGVGKLAVGLVPQTVPDWAYDSDTVYFVFWAPSEATTFEAFLDLPEDARVGWYTQAGNAHLDRWRDFDLEAGVVSTPATAAVAENRIHVEDALLAEFFHGSVVIASSGYAGYEMPVGCELDKVFASIFAPYREMSCPGPGQPEGGYFSMIGTETIESPYAGTWSFQVAQGHVLGMEQSIALAWADVDLREPWAAG
jgi:hypothetical protein